MRKTAGAFIRNDDVEISQHEGKADVMLQKTEYQNSSKFSSDFDFSEKNTYKSITQKTEYDSFNRNQYDNSFNFNKIKQTPFKKHLKTFVNRP